MVAKSYSEHRRKVASDLGLGRKVRSEKLSDTASAASVTAPAARPKKGPKAKAAAAPKALTAQLSAPSDSAVKAKPGRKAAAPKTTVAADIKAAPRATKAAAPKRKPSTAKPAAEPAAS